MRRCGHKCRRCGNNGNPSGLALTGLPDPLLGEAISYLPLNDYAMMTRTSRRMHHVCLLPLATTRYMELKIRTLQELPLPPTFWQVCARVKHLEIHEACTLLAEPRVLKHIGHLSTLERLRLCISSSFSCLSTLQRLVHLACSRPPTVDMLRSLSALPALTGLDCDVPLEWVPSLPHTLTDVKVNIHDSRGLNKEGWQALLRLPLTRLEIGPDASAEQVLDLGKELPVLRSLYLWQHGGKHICLSELSHLTLLHMRNMYPTPVGISALVHLTELRITSTKFTDLDTLQLQRLMALRTLELREVCMTDASLCALVSAVVASAAPLHTLYIRSVEVTNLRPLDALASSLTELYATDIRLPSGREELVDRLPRLPLLTRFVCNPINTPQATVLRAARHEGLYPRLVYTE